MSKGVYLYSIVFLASVKLSFLVPQDGSSHRPIPRTGDGRRGREAEAQGTSGRGSLRAVTKHHRWTGAAVRSPGSPAESMCPCFSSASVHLIKCQGSISSWMPEDLFSPFLRSSSPAPFWLILFGSWFNLKINIWIPFGIQQTYVVCSGFWFVIQFKPVVPISCPRCERSQILSPARAPRRA